MRVRIPPAPAARLRAGLRIARYLSLAAGALLAGWPLYVTAESAFAQWSGEKTLAAQRRTPTASPAAGPRETIVTRRSPATSGAQPRKAGSVLGKFEIPRLELSYILLEGTDDRTLDRSIGHIEGTGLPGQTGNIGIAGHRNTHFRKLEWIRRGDEILLRGPDGIDRYHVEWVRLFDPKGLEVLDPEHGPAITLVTCFPFEYVGAAPLRFVVRALPDAETKARLDAAAKAD